RLPVGDHQIAHATFKNARDTAKFKCLSNLLQINILKPRIQLYRKEGRERIFDLQFCGLNSAAKNLDLDLTLGADQFVCPLHTRNRSTDGAVKPIPIQSFSHSLKLQVLHVD